MSTQTAIPTYNAEWVASLPGDLNSRIEAAKAHMGALPKKPTKPAMKAGLNAEGLRAHADEVAKWESDVAKWQNEWTTATGKHTEISKAIEQHIMDEAGLLRVPEQYRGRVWAHAWDSGHAYGYYEVYSHLCSLIHIFTGN